MPIGIAGSVIGGLGSLVGGGKSASAATKAAQIQANAALAAAQLQHQQFEETKANLAPFVQQGGSAMNSLSADLYNENGGFLSPMTVWGMGEFTPTMESLAKTPGYQFTLQQGLQATNNAYAPMGLAGNITGGHASPSGPLAAAQTQFASGLASQTFNQQYQNWLAGMNQKQGLRLQNFNMLYNTASLGENAAAMQGNIGANTAANIAQTQLGGAAAQAAGVVGSANALNQGLAGFGSSLNSAAMLYALNNGGMFGGSGGGLAAGGSNVDFATSLATPGATNAEVAYFGSP